MVLWLLACAGSPDPQVSQAHLDRNMGWNLADLSAAREAALVGDLPRLQAALRDIANRVPIPGVPEELRGYEAHLGGAALRGAASPNLTGATEALGELISTCGECHAAAGAHPTLPAAPQGAASSEWMARHRWVVGRLEEGLILPDPQAFAEAAAVLALPTFVGMPDPPPRAVVLTDEVRAIANSAAAATTPEARGRAYGALLHTCATCHALYRSPQ